MPLSITRCRLTPYHAKLTIAISAETRVECMANSFIADSVKSGYSKSHILGSL